jgi:hypothetical protein
MIDPQFIMIDLRSQRAAFKDYVQDWTLSEILAWLTRYGRVETVSGAYHLMYVFSSASALYAGFWINDDGELVIPG